MKSQALRAYATKHLTISWGKDMDGPGYICLAEYQCDPNGDVAAVCGGLFFGRGKTKATHELTMIQRAIDDLCADPVINRSHYAAFADAWPLRTIS
jgi:hypothetical protein